MKQELEHHFAIKEHNELLSQANKDLKAQLDSYSDKFTDFQSTLTKSNEASMITFCGAQSHICLWNLHALHVVSRNSATIACFHQLRPPHEPATHLSDDLGRGLVFGHGCTTSLVGNWVHWVIYMLCDHVAHPRMHVQCFGTLKKEIETSNKKRAQALREREDFRKRCEAAEAGRVSVLDENSTLKSQVRCSIEDICIGVNWHVTCDFVSSVCPYGLER